MTLQLLLQLQKKEVKILKKRKNMLHVHIDGKTLVSDRDLMFSHEKKLQNITLFLKKEHYNQTYFDFFRTYFDLSIRLFLWFKYNIGSNK